MHVCLVYDCLYPWTIGGGERWYRALAERLAAAGHEVTYLTLRQWDRGEPPELPGVRVIAVGPRLTLYVDGRRRVAPPVLFGAGVLAHLLRHGRQYDAVHTSSFPYFSLLAAAAARPLGRYRLVVDWFEFWSRAYWRDYLGRVGGRIGWEVQRLCLRMPHAAFCFARLTAERLRSNGHPESLTVLSGMAPSDLRPVPPEPAKDLVVYVGRHIPEKRAPAVVPAIAAARRQLPNLEGVILGDGPEYQAVQRAIADLQLTEFVTAPGFVSGEQVAATLRHALCLVAPSQREGYGLVVLESAAVGVPVVVSAAEDNAAVELVEDGVNGFVAASASPTDLAAAIVKVAEAGHDLRTSTARWYAVNADRLSLESSLQRVLDAYAAPVAQP